MEKAEDIIFRPENSAPSALTTRRIWVKFSRVGFHKYPGAPEDVSYLEQRHRHKFGFKVEIEVGHNERELEFHQVLNFIDSLYQTGALEMNNASCETLAEQLVDKLKYKYGIHRAYRVEVDEDGECAGVVESNPLYAA